MTDQKREAMLKAGFNPDDPKDLEQFDRLQRRKDEAEYERIGETLADTSTWEKGSG